MIGRSLKRPLGIAMAMLLILTAPVQAASIVGVEALQTWNMIIFGDVRTTSAVGGRSFIGGNLTGESARFYVGSDDKPADDGGKGGDLDEAQIKSMQGDGGFVTDGKVEDAPDRNGLRGLTVVGDVGGRDLTLANGSGASIGGNVDTGLRLDGAQTVEVGGGAVRQEIGESDYRSDLGKEFTQTLVEQRDLLLESMTSLSANLAALKPTGEISGTDMLVIKGGAGFNVYSLSLDMFRDAKELSITAADGGTILINVSGESAVLAANLIGGSSNLGQNLIWNFHDAKDLVFDSAFLGTVLAPGALVTTSDYVEGTLVAAGLEQGGALRLASFQGDLSTPPLGGGSQVVTVSATPEPSTWAMLILGFGLVGLTLRRRERRALIVQMA